MNQNRLSLFERAALTRPQDSDEDMIDLMAIMRTLWRGRFWIAAAVAIGLAAAWYHAVIQSVPMFRASATLALEVEQERLVTFESVAQGLSGDDAAVATEMAVIRSRGLITKLVEELSLTEDPEFNPGLSSEPSFSIRGAVRDFLAGLGLFAPPEAAEPWAPSDHEALEMTVNSVMGAIGVEQQEWSYVLVITAFSQDPEKAARIANALAALYIEDRIEVKFEKTRQATAWLSERVADLQRDVETSAGALKAFLASSDLINEETLQAMNFRLKEQRDRLAETVLSSEAAAMRVDELVRAEATANDVEMAAAANDAGLDRLLPRIAAGDDGAAALFERRYAQILGRATEERNRSAAQIPILERAVERQQAEIARQSDDLVRLQQLEREAEANRLIYEYFLTRLKETSVQEGIHQADARVISPAVAPGGPFAPDTRSILALGGAIGLVLSAGGVLFRERFVTAIRTPEELETATGLPVLGQIPRIPGRSRARIVDYLMRKNSSAAVEAVRNLRTSLLLSNIDSPPQVIMVTSAVPGEGKTTTTVALGGNYASLGKKVLVVEGDIRRRIMNRVLNVDTPKAGLLDVISGDASLDEAVCRPDGVRFDVLFGNESPLNPADVLSSGAFESFVKEAREKYDLVIFDTPPLLVVPDARVIGQAVDAILFTVLWNKTTHAQVSDAIRQLTSVGLKITGLVLQNIDPQGMRRLGFGDRYGAYSASYGRNYYKN